MPAASRIPLSTALKPCCSTVPKLTSIDQLKAELPRSHGSSSRPRIGLMPSALCLRLPECGKEAVLAWESRGTRARNFHNDLRALCVKVVMHEHPSSCPAMRSEGEACLARPCTSTLQPIASNDPTMGRGGSHQLLQMAHVLPESGRGCEDTLSAGHPPRYPRPPCIH